jgi:hypothetical protein
MHNDDGGYGGLILHGEPIFLKSNHLSKNSGVWATVNAVKISTNDRLIKMNLAVFGARRRDR